MSDTDDTEKLLLIQPDIFFCPTESCHSFNKRNSKKSQKKCVESIAQRVNKLRLCLEKLETVSFSETSSKNDLPGSRTDIKYTSPVKRNHKYDSFAKRHTLPRRKHHFSSRVNNPYFKFSNSDLSSYLKRIDSCTPLSKSEQTFLSANLENCLSCDFQSSSDCSVVSYLSLVSLNMDSTDTSSLFLSPLKKKDNSMLHEIDAFLNNIEKMEIGRHGLDESSYLDTPKMNNSEIESGHIDSMIAKHKLEQASASKESGLVFTPDFSSKYINWEHDLKLDNKETDLNKSEVPCNKMKYYEEGDLKSSVPDLGYGIRDIMYLENPPNAIEKTVSHQSISSISSIPGKSRLSLNTVKSANSDSKVKESGVEKNVSNTQLLPNAASDNKNSGSVDLISKSSTKSLLDSRGPSIQSDPDVELYSANSKVVKKSDASLPLLNIMENKNFARSFEPIGRQGDRFNKDFNLQSGDGVKSNKIDFTHNQEDNLPSLSELWGASNEIRNKKNSELQKIEEEKLRRVHCEGVIQQLQKRLLEQHQKLAIALQVDSTKDEAIIKLRNALVMVTRKISFIEEKYHQELEKVNLNIKSMAMENEELKKMADQNKAEATKTLQFTQDCQEKYKALFKEKEDIIRNLQSETEKYKDTLKDKDGLYNELKESNTLVLQLNKQMSENVMILQSTIDKMRQDSINLKDEFIKIKKGREALEDEITILRNDKKELSLVISEEKSRNTHLDTQKSKLQQSVDNANKKMKSLEAEFESFKQQAEESKNEMKSYYQKQVENIVMSKLNEFQNQLNAAESLMDDEMQTKERQIAIQFAKQLHKVEQQHKLEVNILEEKHKEEIKLYRLQLAQSSQTIHQLEEKLASYKNRRGQIAAQLHSVMENQWQQALKIITNGGPSNENKLPSNIAGINNPFGDSHLRMYETSNSANQLYNVKKSDPPSNSKMLPENLVSSTTNKTVSNGQIPLSEEDIQRYVKLLLQKAPGVNDLMERNRDEEQEDKSKQNDGISNYKNSHHDDDPTNDRNSDPNNRKMDKNLFMKPPWK